MRSVVDENTAINYLRNIFNIPPTIPTWILLLSTIPSPNKRFGEVELEIPPKWMKQQYLHEYDNTLYGILASRVGTQNIGVLNARTLEHIGDSVLDYVIKEELIIKYGLTISWDEIGEIKKNISSNLELTRLAVFTKICNLIYPPGTGSFVTVHNSCSSLMEALIGAYYYTRGLDETYSWIVNSSPFKNLIDKNIWKEDKYISLGLSRQFPPLGWEILKTLEDVYEFLHAYKALYEIITLYTFNPHLEEYEFIMYKPNSIELKLCPNTKSESEINISDVFETLRNNRIWVMRLETKILNFSV